MTTKGIFAINKPVGITSQRAVQIVKFWVQRQKEKVKKEKSLSQERIKNKYNKRKVKVGHAGTLDPLASGVLVIAVGREFTKKIHEVVNAEKEYLAELKLGETSSTADAEGDKTVVNQKKIPNLGEIRKAIKGFIGRIEQTPPVYSAIKINGQEAYKRVRRGEDVEMKKRTVEIKSIKIISYHYPFLKIKVVCGKGVYIRSLAEDIGSVLKTGAYLSSLKRTRVGNFRLTEAKDLSQFSLKIAIQATELDRERIDGTRVYLSQMLKYFGRLDQDSRFFIYHQEKFNKFLKPPKYKNYFIEKLGKFPLWTQTKFARAIYKIKPDIVWLPLHNLPRFRSPNTRFVVTIHDLAFKLFPETFPKKDCYKLNLQTDYAVRRADKIIAISQATKNDLLKFYPQINQRKITVVHHGFEPKLWQKKIPSIKKNKILKKYQLTAKKFLVHVGAIQPRKNLELLIEVFEKLKEKDFSGKLVLIGGDGWKYDKIKNRAQKSKFAEDIIFTGNIKFTELVTLVQMAQLFVFPSLYEGFGIAGLESLAAGVPVVAARNSSLPEVLGDSALYFKDNDIHSCYRQVVRLLGDEKLQKKLIYQGLERVKKFSWEKTARKNLRVIKSVLS